jgi:cytosine/adenosine deaminase-related metal-dependent hydrolase
MYNESRNASTLWWQRSVNSGSLKVDGHAVDAPGVTFRIWCEHAWLGGPSASDGVLLEIKDERFSRVEMGIPSAPPGCALLPGLTLPGFVNPHLQSIDRTARGMSPAAVLSLTSAITAAISPEDLTALATATYAELSLAGFTTVGEVVTLHHGADGKPFENPNAIGDALREAARVAGVRLALIDMCTLTGSPRMRHGSAYEWVQRLDAWTDALGRNTTVKVVGGIADQTGMGKRGLSDVAMWSGQCGLPVHALVGGNPIDGRSPISALIDATVTTNRGGFAAVNPGSLTADELTAIGQQRGSVIVLADSSMQPFPLGALRAAGGRVIVAQPASATPDPFASLRLLARAASHDATAPTYRASELLRAITADAAGCLGWRDTGLLATGQLADLVTVGTSNLARTDDVLDDVLHEAGSSNITHVAIGGQLVVNNGKHRLGDVAGLLQTALDRLSRFGQIALR